VRSRLTDPDTARTLAVVTVAALLLVLVVVASNAPASLAWGLAGTAVLATVLAIVAIVATQDNHSNRLRLEAQRHEAEHLASEIGEQAAVVRHQLARAQELSARISVGNEDTAAMATMLSAITSTVDRLEGAARVHSSGWRQPSEVIDVRRTVERVVTETHRTVTEVEAGTAWASCPRLSAETSLRLVLESLEPEPEDRIVIRVQARDEQVDITVATDGAGVPSAVTEALRDGVSPFGVAEDGPAYRASLARAIARMVGGDVVAVHALGWSNIVLTLPGVSTPPPSEDPPPILTLQLPLEHNTDDPVASPPGYSVSFD